MADFTAPSFCLGLDFDLDSEPQITVRKDSSPKPARQPSTSANLLPLPTVDEFGDDDFESPTVGPGPGPEVSDPPRTLKRLRRGPTPVAQKPEPVVSWCKVDDEIEEFSSEEDKCRDEPPSKQYRSLHSSSKLSLPAHGVLTTQSDRKRKNVSNAPPSADVDSNSNTLMFPNLTVSPLRRFQLIDSDSDDPSGNDPPANLDANIAGSSSKERDFNSGQHVRTKASGSMSQTEDLWNSFCSEKSFHIPTPAFDEVCDEYFRSMKDNSYSSMAKRISSSSLWFSPLSFILPRSGDSLFDLIALLSIFSLLIHHLSLSTVSAASHFEGFDAEDDEPLDSDDSLLSDLPLRSPPPPTTLTSLSDPESHHGPPNPAPSSPNSNPSQQPSDLPPTKPSPTSFDYWDEDEFEGLPLQTPPEPAQITENATDAEKDEKESKPKSNIVKGPRSYTIEIVCVAFLIMFLINYFTGRKENENLALAWAAKFATKDSIFEKNFSLLGVGDGEDSPLLLKEGQNVFKFYASGRRFCQGLLATMELKSRHDLISRLYNLVVPCRDEISFEVYMNDDAMDNVIFALAKKKAAKTLQKEERDLQRFANLVSPPSNRKWVVEDFGVVSESKEVGGDLITDAVLDQVFGEKAFEKFGKGFISMHFSDQYPGSHKKILMFRFAIPDANHMADMTRLVALVPYYIDLIGRYKLSSQARSKTEAARNKLAQEVYRELQYARQEELQRKKADRKKMMEEAEAKLNAEALRKREAKERARQLKKAMPKVKMTRAH